MLVRFWDRRALLFRTSRSSSNVMYTSLGKTFNLIIEVAVFVRNDHSSNDQLHRSVLILDFRRGSTRDRAKEEELLNSGDPNYAHYAGPLHVSRIRFSGWLYTHFVYRSKLRPTHHLLWPTNACQEFSMSFKSCFSQ